ncbi:MAG: sigma-70 family RNA polymerase sigma factor [Gemmataceae bacterium]
MEPLGAVLGHVYALGEPSDTGDADLLERFRTGDAAAFAALVRRHGPLVYGVCRRLLGDTPDADDAFQATFLLLVRKAGGLRQPNALGPWLFGVARRTAAKARALAAKRARRETPLADAAAPSVDADLGPTLDAAVAALPAKYRAAVVLCYLEGLPHADAAKRLGCPPATVATHLARARDRLRGWLGRRGYGPASFAPPGTVPAALVARTAALTPEAVPSSVAILAEGVGRAMLFHSWSKALTLVALVGLAGTGAWTFGPASAEPPGKGALPPAPPVPPMQRDDWVGVPLAKLRRPAPPEHTLDAHDVLGVYIEGVLGGRDGVPAPLNVGDGRNRLAFGVPVPVLENGMIQVPLLNDLTVRDKTLLEVRDLLREAYIKAGVLNRGKDKVLVSLAQPRTHRVTVVRQDVAAPHAATASVDLSAFENDVLTALARSGGLPALDSRQTVVIHRRRPRTNGDDQRTTIPLSRKSGEPLPFKPEDVILESGDIVVVEGGEPKPPAAPPMKPAASPVASAAVAADGTVAVRCRLSCCELDAAGGLKTVEKVMWCPYPLPQVTATEAGGRRLTAAELAQRLARETPVFVVPDGAGVDSGLLKMLKQDTLVLQLPAAVAPQPAAP